MLISLIGAQENEKRDGSLNICAGNRMTESIEAICNIKYSHGAAVWTLRPVFSDCQIAVGLAINHEGRLADCRRVFHLKAGKDAGLIRFKKRDGDCRRRL
ncbi:MAG: hypothetical protein JEZ11_23115 [Desulfobacterales bacterium]|nr:hypothetical protein [Desulfobacterales bacterium]